MTVVYDKDGVAYNVPHLIDVKGWIDAGYTLDNPKEKKTTEKK